MAEKITVRTFRGDLPQLRLMLHCLNKYWQGNRYISIACTKNGDHADPTIVGDVRKIAEEELSIEWTIDMVEPLNTNMNGYNEAQLYNFTMAMDPNFTDALGLDSKDILLKPCNLIDFKVGNEYKITRFDDSQNRTFSQFYPGVCNDLGLPDLDIPLLLILTPYLFNTEQTLRVWNKITEKFGKNFTDWNEFPTGVEWAVYYIYTLLDQERVINFVDRNSPHGQWMPIGGIWAGQTVAGAEHQAMEFDKYFDRKIWKNSWKVSDLEITTITAKVLSAHGIDQSVIDRWIYEKANTTP